MGAGVRRLGLESGGLRGALLLRGSGRLLVCLTPQGGPLDADGVAPVLDAVGQCGGHLWVVEETPPLAVVEVGSDDGWLPEGIALVHQLEEQIGLLGLQGQIRELVHEQNLESGEVPEATLGGAVGEALIELVEQVLGLDEASPSPLLEGLEEESCSDAGLAHPGVTNQNHVLALSQEVESR